MNEGQDKKIGHISREFEALFEQLDITDDRLEKFKQLIKPILSLAPPTTAIEEGKAEDTNSLSPLTRDLIDVREKIQNINCEISEMLKRVEL